MQEQKTNISNTVLQVGTNLPFITAMDGGDDGVQDSASVVDVVTPTPTQAQDPNSISDPPVNSGEKTFTQSELDSHIKDRLQRERSKFDKELQTLKEAGSGAISETEKKQFEKKIEELRVAIRS